MQVLEASVYAWALEKPELRADAPGEMVGGNFGVPHRDAAYAVSHTAEGLPNILGLWIPVVDVTTENGCMFVVPRERDPMFKTTPTGCTGHLKRCRIFPTRT